MEKKTNTAKYILIFLVSVAALICFDQGIKALVVKCLKEQPSKILIPGVLQLTYLENRGAAFGLLQNQRWFFLVLTIVFLAIALWFFIKTPKTKKYAPLLIVVVVLVAGAIGNFIDRLLYHFVVDFIYFEVINFPVFNIADIYITLSVIALALLLLFHYKEGDFAYLKRQKTAQE